MTSALADPFDVVRMPQVNPEGPLSIDRGWQDEAACIDSDIEFVSDTRGGGLREEVAQAKAICAECPVRRECLEYAFEQQSSTKDGVYGGTAGWERWPLRDHPDRIELLLGASE